MNSRQKINPPSPPFVKGGNSTSPLAKGDFAIEQPGGRATQRLRKRAILGEKLPEYRLRQTAAEAQQVAAVSGRLGTGQTEQVAQ